MQIHHRAITQFLPENSGLPHEPRVGSRQSAAGIGMMLTSSASNQVGAALGAQAFPVIGPVGVVAIRQLITAIVLIFIVRPTIQGLRRHQWNLIIGLALVFSVMNLSLYMSVNRMGLATAVTLEFLGPLTVAIASSRRLIDIACAVLAGTGVVVLTHASPVTDVLGIACGLLAAISWGAYILLNRSMGQQIPGLQGTSISSIIAALIWIPIAIVWFLVHRPTMLSILFAMACGVMSSVIPYITDLLTLRLIPARMFGIFTSVNPVWAALAGWFMLRHPLSMGEWIGIGLIVTSNIVVSGREFKLIFL